MLKKLGNKNKNFCGSSTLQGFSYFIFISSYLIIFIYDEGASLFHFTVNNVSGY